jgi:mitochondrial fission process protein 1
VAQSRKVFHSATNLKVKTWGPTMTGLAIVPILPYLFDHPVEHVTDRAFDWIRTKLIENTTTKASAEKKEL